jgi:hypothetical protein
MAMTCAHDLRDENVSVRVSVRVIVRVIVSVIVGVDSNGDGDEGLRQRQRTST